jgi:hypothetical protein
MEMEEIQGKAKQIIEKPYKDWMTTEKNRIRYNFSENSKRI